jgi:haloalkane dehalogenase
VPTELDLDSIRRSVDVLDSYMTYLDVGSGPTVLFLHGNPTSSYLWRGVIPYLAGQARCVAPDLIGFGRSGKPDIGYRFTDIAGYLDAFIETLGLTDVTLVVHDWGSALGFHYARRHAGNVTAIAFMEAIVAPATWDGFPPDFADLFRAFRDPARGRSLIVDRNAFIEQVLPQAVARGLTAEEMAEYRRPFLRAADRTPLWQLPNDLPIDGRPEDETAVVAAYAGWLATSPVPKLLLAARPGALIPPPFADALEASLPNLTRVDLGTGVHYVQEDAPDAIGAAIADWHTATVLAS